MSFHSPSLRWPSISLSRTTPTEDAPLDRLPPAEAEALSQLRALVEPHLQAAHETLPDCDAWRTLRDVDVSANKDSCVLRDELLLRFLRYNCLNAERAARQVRDVVQWRQTTRVALMPVETMHGIEVGLPITCLLPCTADGNTLFFAKASAYSKKDVVPSQQIDGVAAMFEQMLYSKGGPRAKRAAILIDFSDFGYKNVDLWGMKRGIVLFTSYFPDVFSKIILVNYPKFIYGVWRAVAPLVDSRTTSRMVWVCDATNVYGELRTLFEAHQIPTWLGGQLAAHGNVTLYNDTELQPEDLEQLFR